MAKFSSEFDVISARTTRKEAADNFGPKKALMTFDSYANNISWQEVAGFSVAKVTSFSGDISG